MGKKIRFLEDRHLTDGTQVFEGETCEDLKTRTGIEINPDDKAKYVNNQVAEYVADKPSTADCPPSTDTNKEVNDHE